MADDNYYGQQPQTQAQPQQYYRQQAAYGQQQAYQQQYQQPYQQPQAVQTYAQPADEPVSTGEWVLNLFLVAIPLVGIVMLFVWAFGSSTTETKRNWARANLIWILIAIVLSIIMSVATAVMGVSLAGMYGR